LKLLPFVPDGPEITERHAHRRKLNSGLSCEDVQIPLAFVKPSQYVLFDAYGFRSAAHGHGKRERLVTAQFRSSQGSLALSSRIICHCPFETASGPPHNARNVSDPSAYQEYTRKLQAKVLRNRKEPAAAAHTWRRTDKHCSEPDSYALSVKYLTHRYRDRWYRSVRPLCRECSG
jgi:hypothetical protein